MSSFLAKTERKMLSITQYRVLIVRHGLTSTMLQLEKRVLGSGALWCVSTPCAPQVKSEEPFLGNPQQEPLEHQALSLGHIHVGIKERERNREV